MNAQIFMVFGLAKLVVKVNVDKLLQKHTVEATLGDIFKIGDGVDALEHWSQMLTSKEHATTFCGLVYKTIHPKARMNQIVVTLLEEIRRAELNSMDNALDKYRLAVTHSTSEEPLYSVVPWVDKFFPTPDLHYVATQSRRSLNVGSAIIRGEGLGVTRNSSRVLYIHPMQNEMEESE